MVYILFGQSQIFQFLAENHGHSKAFRLKLRSFFAILLYFSLEGAIIINIIVYEAAILELKFALLRYFYDGIYRFLTESKYSHF